MRTGIRQLAALMLPATLLLSSMASAATVTGTHASATARFLAKATGKSVASVESLHRADHSWAKVAATLGIGAPQWKLDRKLLRLGRFEAEGHRQAQVQALAHASGKTVAQLGALRKTDRTWKAVAQALHVNLATLAPDVRAAARRIAVARAAGALLVGELAHATGKSRKEIQAMRKADHSLKSVAISLGLGTMVPTYALLARQRAELAFARVAALVGVLAKDSGKPAKEIRSLILAHGLSAAESSLGLNAFKVHAQVAARMALSLRARVADRAVVGLLSKLSGKRPSVIQGMLKSDKTWVGVAKALGY